MFIPKLSIIVPVYNKGKYLSRCLESLIKQTYKNLEIICIDDGSIDNSAQILEEFSKKDGRIQIIRQKNKGQSAARNLGIKLSTGKYITFIDADDYIEEAAYKNCISVFENRSGLDVVCFGAEVLLGEKGAIKQKSDDHYYSVHQKGEQWLTPKLIFKENASVCTRLFRTSLMKDRDIYFREGFWYEDFDFYWRYMVNARKAYFLENKFYKYIRYKNSIMASTFRGNDKGVHHLILADHLFSYFINNGRLDVLEEIGERMFLDNFWLSYRHSSVAKRKEVLQLAKKITLQYDLQSAYPDNAFIKDIIFDKLYKHKNIDEYNFFKKVFSVKKMDYVRYIRIFGLKLEFKRKKYKKMIEFYKG